MVPVRGDFSWGEAVTLIFNFLRKVSGMQTKKISISLLTALVIAAYTFFIGTSNAGDMEAAKTLYKGFCTPCHGDKGIGDGPNAEGLDPAPRDLTDNVKEKYMVKRTSEELYKAISLGGREIEKSGLMPPFGKTFSEKEIWQIVAYIQTFYTPVNPGVDFSKEMNATRPTVDTKAPAISEPSRKETIRGKRAYGKYGCSGCHKIKGRGAGAGLDLTGIGAKLKPEQIYQVIQNARSVKADSLMPVYGLGEDKAAGITKYLMTLK